MFKVLKHDFWVIFNKYMTRMVLMVHIAQPYRRAEILYLQHFSAGCT